MKKTLIAAWTIALTCAANAADTVTNVTINPEKLNTANRVTENGLDASLNGRVPGEGTSTCLAARVTGDGTSTCLAAERVTGDGTSTCLAERSKKDLVQLEKLKKSLKVRSPEEREVILNKLIEILNDDSL